jgi:hypothetical protein
MADNISSASITEANKSASSYPFLPAGVFPPLANVVGEVTHKKIVGRLEAEIVLLDADLSKAWQAHQVGFVALVTALITHFVFWGRMP